MSIRETAVNAVIESIPGKLFIVGRAPGSKWQLPVKKEPQPQTNKQGREQVFVEWLGEQQFA
jgi:hypothetical protein